MSCFISAPSPAQHQGIGEAQKAIPPILKAAKKAGVKCYFIEDESPSSEQQIPNPLTTLSR